MPIRTTRRRERQLLRQESRRSREQLMIHWIDYNIEVVPKSNWCISPNHFPLSAEVFESTFTKVLENIRSVKHYTKKNPRRMVVPNNMAHMPTDRYSHFGRDRIHIQRSIGMNMLQAQGFLSETGHIR
uniref:(northern house mosquito) hypothetical protein n=1 Tax=Culex pipiens TaxID=7175 RepID=A0A8D8G1R4_CULPI